MAISHIGSNTQAISGANAVTVTTPGSTANGDLIFLHFVGRRSGGTNPSLSSTPSGFTTINNNTTNFYIKLFYQVLTSSPAANYTLNFNNSDVHGTLLIDVWRGSGTPSVAAIIFDSNTSIISSIATNTNASVVLSLYGTKGVTLTLPPEQTSILDSDVTGPPAYTISAAYETVASAGSVGDRTVVASVSGDIGAISIILSESGAQDGFVDSWFDFGFTYTGVVTELLLDNVRPYAYLMSSEILGGPISNVEQRIRKIDRLTKTVVGEHIFIPYYSSAYGFRHITQDENHIYSSGVYWNFTPSFNRIQITRFSKDNLQPEQVGSYLQYTVDDDASCFAASRWGWSRGTLLFAGNISYQGTGQPQDSYYRLYSIDASSLSHTIIHELPPNKDPLAVQIYIPGSAIVAKNGDFYFNLTKYDYLTFTNYSVVLCKISSNFTLTEIADITQYMYSSVFGATNGILLYDYEEDTIFIFNTIVSRIIKFHVPSQSILQVRTFGMQTQSGAMLPMGGQVVSLNGERCFFVGPFTDIFSSTLFPYIYQIRASDLSIVRSIAIPNDHQGIEVPVISAEKQVWALMANSTHGPAGAHDVMVLSSFLIDPNAGDPGSYGGDLTPKIFAYGTQAGLAVGFP